MTSCNARDRRNVIKWQKYLAGRKTDRSVGLKRLNKQLTVRFKKLKPMAASSIRIIASTSFPGSSPTRPPERERDK